MTHWIVKMNRGRRGVHVCADYHVIEAGALKFRNTAPYRCGFKPGYPINVIAFAQGEWASVENLSIETPTNDR